MRWEINSGQNYTKNSRELHKNILENLISNTFVTKSNPLQISPPFHHEIVGKFSASGISQESLGVHKILVRKILFDPPRRKGPKMRKNYNKSSNLTLFFFGGGERNFMDKAISWTSGRF